MELTKRKIEFLEEVIRVYDESHKLKPVHYNIIAEKLHVSKWTAYDMLNELEKGGFLKRIYLTKSRKKVRGRSRVYFIPTTKARDILNYPGSIPNEWPGLRSQMLSYFHKTKTDESVKEIETIIDEVSKNKNLPAIISGAYILTLLILYVRSLGFNSLEILRNIMTIIPQSEMGLTLFVGILLGMFLKKAGTFQIKNEMIEHVQNFQKTITEINEPEKKLLFEYFQEAVELKPPINNST